MPLERVETRRSSRMSGKWQPTPGRYHRQAIVPGENFFRRSNRQRLSSRGMPLLTALNGRSPRNNWGDIRTSGSRRLLCEGGDGCPALQEKGWGRNIKGFGDEYVAALTLSGNKATLSENESQRRMHDRRSGSMSVPFAKLDPEIKPSLSATTLKAITKQKISLAPAVSFGCKASGQTQNDPRAPAQSSPSPERIGASSRKGLLPLKSHQQLHGFRPSCEKTSFGGKLGVTGEKKKNSF